MDSHTRFRSIVLALAGLTGVAVAWRVAGPAEAAEAAKAAPAAAPARPRGPALPAIDTWTLDNGLAVYYLGVHDSPVVSVQMFYRVGSKDEPRDRRGSARIFNYMMFQGSTRVPAAAHARMVGELGGTVNAFTQWDVSAYQNTVPRQYLDFAVQLEAERMRKLLLRPSMVAAEREVMKRERRARIDASPLARTVEAFFALAYLNHPYAWGPSGAIEDLELLTPEELQVFYDRYYQPNNAALVVAGDVTRAQVEATARTWFGAIPRAEEPPRPAAQAVEPPQDTLRRSAADSAGKLGIVMGGYHIPAASHADIPALRVAASVLSDGESSRLAQRLVRGDKIAVSTAGQVLALEHPGMFFVYGAHLAADEAAPLEKGLLDEVTRLGTQAVPAKELDKAKNQLIAKLVFGLGTVQGLAEQVGQSWALRGDGRAWLGDIAALSAVTAADVQRVAKKYLVPSNLTLLIVPVASGGGER
jgi:zinc protease